MTSQEMNAVSLSLYLLLILGYSSAQQSLKCPNNLGWVLFDNKCYKFYSFPRVVPDQAAGQCEIDGAALVSIGSEKEHQFVDRYLRQEDLKRNEWLTSGKVITNGDVEWSGDGSTTSYVQFNKFSEAIERLGGIGKYIGKHVIYVYQTTEYKWFVDTKNEPLAFICEISLSDVYKIVEQFRDFDYGLNVESADRAPRGPTFDVEPQDVVILSDTNAVHFDCVAKGLPDPKYEWRYASQIDQPFTALTTTDRYTLTTGRLTINTPRESNQDAGFYQCVAENDQGIVLSSPMRLSFGELGNFSNIAPATVIGREYSGAQLECPTITGSPAISYQWFKNSFTSFIRPDFQPHTFVSESGKLLFSELSVSDKATYYCVASVTSFGEPGNYEGAFQTATRTSKGFELDVRSGTGSNFEPDIQNGFIFIFPKKPMRGAPVQLECFAYGTLELNYSWRRLKDMYGNDDPTGALPVGHKFKYNNRILQIDPASLEDSGVYECAVFGVKTSVTKTAEVTLKIQSKPFFTYELAHQHKDFGSKLVWQCEAAGSPLATYTWYKDGQVINSDTAEGRRVSKNTLIIDALKDSDNGMYQCAAQNDNGRTFSTAQLRVLKIAPSFEKRPMARSVTSAIGSNVTLVCDPAAAPAPEYSWTKDGRELTLSAGRFSEADHHKLLLNGNLMISMLSQADQGVYTCRVNNLEGNAEDSTQLLIMESTSIIVPPSDITVVVNQTVTITCEATKPNNIDMIYVWKFEDYIIDYSMEPEYRQGVGRTAGYLYVQPAKFKNEGRYTCVATTGMDSRSAQMYLSVKGPPSEPAGVHVKEQPVVNTNSSASYPPTTRWITWTDGETNGSPISHYFVEYKTQYDKDFKTYGPAIPNYETVSELYQDHHFYQVNDLKAGVGIQFRVRAQNLYGLGNPSIATEMIQIPGVKPSHSVTNIRGGHGSVGDLVILWDPLPLADHNAPNLRYVVRYRKYDENNRDPDNQDAWQKSEDLVNPCFTSPFYQENHEYIFLCKYVHLVGRNEYYTQYETTVQAINDKGEGPISDVEIVWSAEELPLQAPTNIYAIPYNATALMVKWKEIPNTRESVRGILAGYKINYWHMTRDLESDARQNIIHIPKGKNNLDHGLIIGLNATDWYRFNVQAYNSAGNGPKSSDYEQQTRNKVPGQYPTEVHVYSVDGLGVRVTFRGISTQIREEPLIGYKVQVWEAQENILSAREIDFGKMPTGVIRNLTSSRIYQLRVYGYSRAGQGKRSSPTIQFTVGGGQLTINQETMEIMNSAPVTAVSVVMVILMSLVHFCFSH